MSDGINDYARRERIERDKAKQNLKAEIVKVLDEMKWVVAEDIMDKIEEFKEEE